MEQKPPGTRLLRLSRHPLPNPCSPQAGVQHLLWLSSHQPGKAGDQGTRVKITNATTTPAAAAVTADIKR